MLTPESCVKPYPEATRSIRYRFREGGEVCILHQEYGCLWYGEHNDAEMAPFGSELFDDPECGEVGPTSLWNVWARLQVDWNQFQFLAGHLGGIDFDSGWLPRDLWSCSQSFALTNIITSPTNEYGGPRGFRGGWVEITPCTPCCGTACFLMGSSGSMRIGCTGLLRLFINDDFVSDNSGEWSGWMRINGFEIPFTLAGNPGSISALDVAYGDMIEWYFTGGIDVCTPGSVCPYGSAVYDPDGFLLSGSEIPVFNQMPCPQARRYTLCGIIEGGV